MSAVQYHMDDTVKAHKEVWSKQERKAYKQQIKRKKRMIFIGCLLVNLGILAVLKYTNFAIANVNSIAALFTRQTLHCPCESGTAAWHFLLYVSDNGICD